MERSMCFSIEDITYKPIQIEQLNKIAKKNESILKITIQKVEILQQIAEIGQRYEKLLNSKSSFQSAINDAIVKQDNYKQ